VQLTDVGANLIASVSRLIDDLDDTCVKFARSANNGAGA
jgi:hypothetical protein